MRFALLVLLFLVWPMAEAGSVGSSTVEPSNPAPPILKLEYISIAEGKVGYYGPGPWANMRNGQPYDPTGHTIAVDDKLYRYFVDTYGLLPEVVLENMETGEQYYVRAADSGYFPPAYAADMGDEVWLLVSGKPASSGVFRGRILIGRVQ